MDTGRRIDRRRDAERLVQRAAWLRPDERALIEAVFGEGRSCTDLAKLMGATPEVVRRRVRRAAKRAGSDLFGFVASRRDTWPAELSRVATKCALEGATLRGAAADLGVSLHVVRRHWDAVRAMCAAEGGTP